jgi:hypothetical protein
VDLIQLYNILSQEFLKKEYGVIYFSWLSGDITWLPMMAILVILNNLTGPICPEAARKDIVFIRGLKMFG